ncbi:zinc finger protein Xfin-like [Myzus persicae]|uniref:zinc finger protein Xfin-like n=1 Tax=Myzus persicae TaxID=13164 RepID=UPI000B932333|nr:zinc finger protein Xfin-like [Myzus persicae]XP_022163114.1 zinc finger protein Xfin-like [Myzus persicae]
MSRLHHIQPEVSIFAVSPNPPPKPRKIKSEPPPLKPAIWPSKQPAASMQLQQFLKAQRLSQKQLVQRGPPPLNKMQYFANDSRTEYQKQQQAMHQKMMQQRAIINSHTNNNSIREDSPNPMDFLEIGVHAGNCIINNIPRDKPRSNFKSGGSLSQSDSGSRRKNANPRKVARENEIEPPGPSDHFLLSQIKQENLRQSCLLCERNFSNKIDLSQHISEVHGIEPSDLHKLNGHLGEDEELAESMMEAETVFFCEVCTREFQDKASLWLHMVRGHKQEAAVTCGVCMKICSDSKSLMEHVNIQHPKNCDTADSVQRRYRCQVCARQHDTKKKMMRHVVIHTVYDNDGQIIDPDKLIIINNNFHPTKSSNNEHYTISCQVCHKVFPSEEKLLRHMSSVHLMTGCDDMITTTAVTTTGNSSQSSFVNRCELCGDSCGSRTEKWWHVLKEHGTNETLICPKPDCRKLFVSPSLQIEHQSHHETQGELPNTCEVCGRLWPNRNDFYKHIMAVHAECMPLLCGICLKVHVDVPNLREHIKEKHEPLVSKENAIYCDICGRTYTKWSKMMRHRSIHNVEDQVSHFVTDQLTEVNLKCTLCPDTEFKTVEEISEHRKNDHQLHVCDLCSKYYSGNNHLWKHVSRQHKGHPDVTCSLCARTSASKVHLKRHMIKYHSDPVDQLIDKSNNSICAELNAIHQCIRCDKVFRIRSLLKKHLKYCKGKRDAMPIPKEKGHYPCTKCGKTFEYQTYLNRHLKHSHLVQYCEICSEDKTGEHFDSKMLLMDHIREKHGNDPELCCDVEGCDKVMRTKVDCQKHKRDHVRKVFSYVCEFCGDMHSNKKTYRKHLRQRHKGNTQYLCGVCMEVCVDNDGLSKHLHEAHPQTFSKSNICQICGKMFTLGSKVGEHIDKIHGKNLKPCKICWKVFSDMDKLKDHIENHPAKEEFPKVATPVKKPIEPKPKTPKLYGLPKELAELGFNEEQQESLKRDIDDVTSDINTKRLRKLHSCTVCYKSFRFETDLYDHKREEHSIIEDSYMEEETERKEQQPAVPKSNKTVCGICKKEWISLKHFWQHLIRAHRTEAAFVCGICCKITKNYDELALHLDNHHPNATVLSLFACDVCGRNHNAFSKLQKHRIIHSTAPPVFPKFHCDECELVFNSKSYGEKHILSHGPGSKLCKGKDLCQEMDEDMLDDQIEEEEEEEEEVEDGGDVETENKGDDDEDEEEEEEDVEQIDDDGDDDDNEQNDDVEDDEDVEQNAEEEEDDDDDEQNDDVDAEEDKEQVEADDDEEEDVEENGVDDQDDDEDEEQEEEEDDDDEV